MQKDTYIVIISKHMSTGKPIFPLDKKSKNRYYFMTLEYLFNVDPIAFIELNHMQYDVKWISENEIMC